MENVSIILLGNDSDKVEERVRWSLQSTLILHTPPSLFCLKVVDRDRAQAMADEFNIPYMEGNISPFQSELLPNFNLAYRIVSAKTGENVNEAFMKLVLDVKHRLIDNAK